MATELFTRQAELVAIKVQHMDLAKQISQSQETLNRINTKIHVIVCTPENVLPFLMIGRLVFIKKEEVEWGWGIVLNFNKKKMNIQ